MIITRTLDEGEDRVYVTRFASVATYFTASEDDTGVVLHVEPGLFSDPATFARSAHDVELAALREVGVRLGVPPEDVSRQSFAALKRIADPELPEHYRYARRSKNKAVPIRF